MKQAKTNTQYKSEQKKKQIDKPVNKQTIKSEKATTNTFSYQKPQIFAFRQLSEEVFRQMFRHDDFFVDDVFRLGG